MHISIFKHKFKVLSLVTSLICLLAQIFRNEQKTLSIKTPSSLQVIRLRVTETYLQETTIALLH